MYGIHAEEIFLTPKQLQEKLQLKSWEIERLLKVPDLPIIKIGDEIRIPQSAFYRYLTDHKQIEI